MIDKVRYYLALVMLAAIPPAFLFWFSIHPFIRFWRRMGVRLTLVIHYTVMIAMMVLTILYAGPLLSVQFGTSPVLIGLAIPILVLSGVLRRRLWNYLRPKVLMGVPELAPEQHGIPLITGGIYSLIRHPRYVQFFLAVLGWALFCNYLALYLFLPVLATMMYCLVLIEERELRGRYGAEYDAYCSRVPRFIPKIRA
jgi:protein-S-isoprenylcysteine O-methyltransferase Ste14